ncbi:MAG: magnesium/cobalt transporter CorA [Nanoarchaeota archaeon]|nr:magnesium/cobalt transporter CorA [Nanoarchaeota archaeon]
MEKFSVTDIKDKSTSPETAIAGRTGPVKITYFDYDAYHIEEKNIEHAEECFRFRDTNTVTWINIDGLQDKALIGKICNHFKIHQVIQDNIFNIDQRPDIEDCQSYIYLSFKMLYFREGEITSKQISLILSKNFLISFQEEEGDVFGQIRDKIRNNLGKIRKNGNDFLAYLIIEAVVHNYFHVLEAIGEAIDEIEEEALSDPSPKTSRKISMLQKEMIYLRKAVWPLREVLIAFERSDNKLIRSATRIYLRDLYEHVVQAIETCEIYRETISSMLEVYVSSISNKMNDVMKTLTIFSAIFIPLTFIVGVYGMNFKNVPELEWSFGYPLVWTVMLSLVIIMFVFFRKKKWI